MLPTAKQWQVSVVVTRAIHPNIAKPARIAVGSFGTIGVLVQLTLRCRPRSELARWYRADADADLYRASSILWDGDATHMLLEGVAADVAAQGRGHREEQNPPEPFTSRGNAVARIFLAQGAIIGLVGTTLGLLGGLAVSYVVDRSGWIRINPAVYFIDHLPVHVELVDVIVVVLASVGIALLATLYPSRSAARLTPVEAIRHE